MAGITSPERRHLAHDTVMRIEVSLSSRRSSVVVFNTTARLYTLDNGEWKSMAYGAPCILLVRETTEPDSPFAVKLVIAELESGINLWEEVITDGTEYTEQRPTFHTFTSSTSHQTLAVQFADADEAKSMLASLKQFYSQKQQVDKLLKRRPVKTEKSRKSTKKRLSKYDISQPCNFKHISGLTNQRTDVCEQELRGTIQRRLRSQSMSTLESQKTKRRGKLPHEFTDGALYNGGSSRQAASHSDLGQADSPYRRTTAPPNMESNRAVLRNKYHSLRMAKRKPLGQFAQSVDDLALHQPASYGREPIPNQNRYSMTLDIRDMPESWMEKPNNTNSPIPLTTSYPGPQLTSVPPSSPAISTAPYTSHQPLHTSPIPGPAANTDREHFYINTSPVQGPMPTENPIQMPPQQQPSGPVPVANPMPPQQQPSGLVPVANPIPPQQQSSGPIPIANPIPLQRQPSGPAPVVNPIPPQQQPSGPIPIANPIPLQRQPSGPVPVVNPMPPQQQASGPIPVANPMPPQQIPQQQFSYSPIATASPMPPWQVAQQQPASPIPTANPVPPQQQFAHDPIPTPIPMSPQQFVQGPIPIPNPVPPQEIPQQFARGPIPTANPMPLQQTPQQQFARGPIPTTNSMPPQQTPQQQFARGPIPITNSMPPQQIPQQQFARGPIPTTNSMPPQQTPQRQFAYSPMPPQQIAQQQPTGPIPTATPIPPQQHHPAAVQQVASPARHTPSTAFMSSQIPPEVPLATHPRRRLLSNPVDSHKHSSKLRKKPSWVDNCTPVLMSPVHVNNTGSISPTNSSGVPISHEPRQLLSHRTSMGPMSSSAGHPPMRQTSQPQLYTNVQPQPPQQQVPYGVPRPYSTTADSRSYSRASPAHQFSSPLHSQHVSHPVAATTLAASRQPAPSFQPPPVLSGSQYENHQSYPVRQSETIRHPAQESKPVTSPKTSPAIPAQVPTVPPPGEDTNDPEMDQLTDELSRLLREFDYLIPSPNKGKPTTLV